MDRTKVLIAPEVVEYIDFLPDLLLSGGYYSNVSNADKYADDILDFIKHLPRMPHYSIPPEFEYHFWRYGKNLQYAFYRKGSTTWYIFFVGQPGKILVTHISNNWIEGQYIR